MHNFSMQSSPQFTMLTFMLSYTRIVDFEHLQGTCSPIFAVEDFLDYFYSYLFFNPRFKFCVNYKWCFIWLHILVKFYYIIFLCWQRNSRKNLYFYILFKQLKHKSPLCFEIIPLSNADTFFTTRQCQSFSLGMNQRMICFSRFELFFDL